MVPMVPRTLAAVGMDVCGGILGRVMAGERERVSGVFGPLGAGAGGCMLLLLFLFFPCVCVCVCVLTDTSGFWSKGG